MRRLLAGALPFRPRSKPGTQRARKLLVIRSCTTVLAGLVLILAACGTDTSTSDGTSTSAPSTVPTTQGEVASADDGTEPVEPAVFAVTYSAGECDYEGPETVEAGLAQVLFVNETDASVGLNIWRLDAEVTYDEFREVALSSAPDDIADTMAFLPGPGSDPGPLTPESVFHLAEGNHALMCLVIGDDGSPPTVLHVRSLEAVGSSPGVTAEQVIEATNSVASLVSYDGSQCLYQGADTIEAGTFDVAFVNTTAADIGLHIAHLNEGVTYDQFKTQIESGSSDDIAPVAAWMITPEDNPGPASQNRTFAAASGTYALTCVLFDEPGPPSTIHIRSIDAR